MDEWEGWAEIEIRVANAVPVWAIVKDWTPEERDRLKAGAPEARDALEQQLITNALKRGDVTAVHKFKYEIEEAASV